MIGFEFLTRDRFPSIGFLVSVVRILRVEIHKKLAFMVDSYVEGFKLPIYFALHFSDRI